MIENMNELNFKDIKGKRIRRHYVNRFYLFLYAVPLFLCSIQPVFWQTIKFFPIVCLLLFLALCLLFVCDNFFGKILCILSEQELYFNNLVLVEINASNKKREMMCSGSVRYEDIKSMEYFPPTPRFNISKVQSRVPQSVILQGSDFQLTVPYGNKSLIRQLKKRQKDIADCIAIRGITDLQQLEHQREGVWKEIWDRFKKHKATDIFGKEDRITDFCNLENDNYIHVRVRRGKNEFTFDINEMELIMMAEHSHNACDVPLSQISNISELYAHMQNFIVLNAD